MAPSERVVLNGCPMNTDMSRSSNPSWTWCRLRVFVWLLAMCLVTMSGVEASQHVHEVRKGTLEQFMTGKLFVITFVDSPGCSRCRNLFPFFAAAAQSFAGDADIFFTRTYDHQLVQDWDVSELPALVYHRKNVDETDAFGTRGILSVDVTVDDIMKGIENVLHGDFEDIKKNYVISLEPDSYDELVTTPSQSVIMLLYDTESKKETLSILEKAAFAFRRDDGIVFTSLDVDKYSKLRDERFKTKDTPCIMWLGENNKNKVKRFGGMMALELLVTFINEVTGLHRLTTGVLAREAGRVSVVDELLEEHADIVSKADRTSMDLLQSAIQAKRGDLPNHQALMLDYYVSILEAIAVDGSSSSVLENLLMKLEADMFGDEDMSEKALEVLRRRNNILIHVKDLVKRYNSGQWHSGKDTDSGVDSSVILEAKHHVHTEL